MISRWQEVTDALAAEFADITDVTHLTRIAIRLLMAGILGGFLGLERESQGKSAGVRTHMLVSMGAALFVLVPSLAGAQPDAISRVVQGVVAGIGFLGAGTILKNGNLDTHRVRGLTTAAGLWITAGIGVTAGMGKEATALLSTILALLVLRVVPWMVSFFLGKNRK